MILVYTEHNEGQFSKKTLEALSYAKALSDKVVALAVNVADATVLQTYGADKIITVTSDKLTTFSVKTYVELILQVAQKEQVSTVLLPSSANTRYLAPVLAVKWGATYLSNISSLPKDGKVQKVVFSSKAIAWLPLAQKQVITLAGNATEVKQAPVQAEIETFAPTLSEDHITLVGTEKFTSKVSIDDAAIVVSGGRGMQTPDNWHIVEDLADALGAATACTKPVSDMGWRPHSEHIGQTGKPLSCDLYIALGVSGAIQHIAGVNASKVKVVINSDPEVMHLIIANVLFFILAVFIPVIQDKAALYYFENPEFHWWQLFSHLFMHGSVPHLFFNMFALYSFGVPLERYFGSNRFILFYFACGLGAGLLHLGVTYYEFHKVADVLYAHDYTKEQLIAAFAEGRISYPSTLTGEDVQQMYEAYMGYWWLLVCSFPMLNSCLCFCLFLSRQSTSFRSLLLWTYSQE